MNPEASITYNLEAKGFEDSREFISLSMKKWFLIHIHVSNTGLCQSKRRRDVPAFTLSAQIPFGSQGSKHQSKPSLSFPHLACFSCLSYGLGEAQCNGKSNKFKGSKKSEFRTAMAQQCAGVKMFTVSSNDGYKDSNFHKKLSNL